MNMKTGFRLQTGSPLSQRTSNRSTTPIRGLYPQSKSPVAKTQATTSSPLHSSRSTSQNKTPELFAGKKASLSGHNRKISAPKLNNSNKIFDSNQQNNPMTFTFQKVPESFSIKQSGQGEHDMQNIDDSIENTVSRLMTLICSNNPQDSENGQGGNNGGINQTFSDLSFHNVNEFSGVKDMKYGGIVTEDGYNAPTFSNFNASKRTKTLPANDNSQLKDMENVYRPPRSSVENIADTFCSSDIEEFRKMQAQLNERGKYTDNDDFEEGFEGFYAKRASIQFSNINSEPEGENIFNHKQGTVSSRARQVSGFGQDEFLNAYSKISSNYSPSKKKESVANEKVTGKISHKKTPSNITVKSADIRSKSPRDMKSAASSSIHLKKEPIKNVKTSPVKKAQSRDVSPPYRRATTANTQNTQNTQEDVVKRTENDEAPKSTRRGTSYKDSKNKGDGAKVFDKNVNFGLMSSNDIVKHCQAMIRNAKNILPKQVRK